LTPTLAERIIMAGKKARGEIPTPPLSDPPADSMAAAILRACAKRRGEVPEPEDKSPAAQKANMPQQRNTIAVCDHLHDGGEACRTMRAEIERPRLD
jgi:hypothetical protein